jgi:hypothetical protein
MTVLTLTLGAKSSDAAFILLEDDTVASPELRISRRRVRLWTAWRLRRVYGRVYRDRDLGATGAESGGVFGSDWDLEVDGDTFLLGTVWIFSNGRNAGVVTRTLLEWFVTPFLRGEHVLPQVSEFDSPTSEGLIEPWVAALEAKGVAFRFEETVAAIRDDGAGRILNVELYRGKDQQNEVVEADA